MHILRHSNYDFIVRNMGKVFIVSKRPEALFITFNKFWGRVLGKQSREQGWFRCRDRRTGTCARSSKLVSNHVFTLSLINFADNRHQNMKNKWPDKRFMTNLLFFVMNCLILRYHKNMLGLPNES